MLIKIIAFLKNIFFFLFILSIPWQKRHIFWDLPVEGEFNEWTAISIYVSDIFFGLALIFWLLQIIFSFSRKTSYKLQVTSYKQLLNNWGLLIVLLIFTIFPLIHARNLNIAFFRWVKLLEMILLFIFIALNFKKLTRRKIIYILILITGTVQSLIAITQYFTQSSLGLKIFGESVLNPEIIGVAKIVVNGEKIIRAYGTFPHPNVLAGFLILPILICFYFWLESKRKENNNLELRNTDSSVSLSFPRKRESSGLESFILDPRIREDDKMSFVIQDNNSWKTKKVILSILLILFVVAEILTFSRSAWLASVISLIGLIILNYHQLRKILVPLLVLGATIIASVLIFYPEIKTRETIVDSQSGDFALSNRAFLNNLALKMIADHPLTGIGIGGFVLAIQDYSNNLPAWRYQPVHNLYLAYAAEIGIIGLLIFLALIWQIILRVITNLKNNETQILFLTLVAFLVISFFDHYFYDLQQGILTFWLILGLILRIKKPLQNKQR